MAIGIALLSEMMCLKARLAEFCMKNVGNLVIATKGTEQRTAGRCGSRRSQRCRLCWVSARARATSLFLSTLLVRRILVGILP